LPDSGLSERLLIEAESVANAALDGPGDHHGDELAGERQPSGPSVLPVTIYHKTQTSNTETREYVVFFYKFDSKSAISFFAAFLSELTHSGPGFRSGVRTFFSA
jgi:hypothetical protein